jgi:hypothetical protein
MGSIRNFANFLFCKLANDPHFPWREGNCGLVVTLGLGYGAFLRDVP